MTLGASPRGTPPMAKKSRDQANPNQQADQ
jgi:hypothetical protein